MSRTVEIPGGSATLRERSQLKQRDRRALEAASVAAAPAIAKIQDAQGDEEDPTKLDMGKVGLTREEFDALYDMQDQTILSFLEGWTLDQPLPATAEDLNDLDAELYDALREVTKSDGAEAIAPVDFSESPDRERPTGDGSDSAGPSKGEPESESTER